MRASFKYRTLRSKRFAAFTFAWNLLPAHTLMDLSQQVEDAMRFTYSSSVLSFPRADASKLFPVF